MPLLAWSASKTFWNICPLSKRPPHHCWHIWKILWKQPVNPDYFFLCNYACKNECNLNHMTKVRMKIRKSIGLCRILVFLFHSLYTHTQLIVCIRVCVCVCVCVCVWICMCVCVSAFVSVSVWDKFSYKRNFANHFTLLYSVSLEFYLKRDTPLWI